MEKDQAATLRETFSDPAFQSEGDALEGVRSIAVTSGKGGVGKTNLTVNIAISLARSGKKVLLMDADMGLANVDIVLNLAPKYTIDDVLTGKRNINDVIIEGPEGLHILPASSGISEMAELDRDQQMKLIKELGKLQFRYDYLLIDTGAGISSNVLRFNASADEIFIVTTPEPTSMTDAYALMKIMSTRYQISKFNLIVNQAEPEEVKSVFKRLTSVAKQYQAFELVYAGYFPKDKRIVECVQERTPITIKDPGSNLSRAFQKLANYIDKTPETTIQHKSPSFWDRVVLWRRNN